MTFNTVAQLTQENTAFKAKANQMRELNLDLVLTQMFKAVEIIKSKNKTRQFELTDGTIVEFTGNQWQDQTGNKNGKGAINLLMYLSGYEQSQYKQAVRDLAEVFGDKEATTSLANHLVETAPREIHKILREPFEIPHPSNYTWPTVRDFLVNQLKLPAPLIDDAHQTGLIFSDRRKNCVFPCYQMNGVFKIGFGSKPFMQKLGRDSGPYVLTGTDSAAYVTDSPVDALALKAMHPDSTIVATGDYLTADKLKPHLDQREVFLTYGTDHMSQQISEATAKQFPKAKRLLPDQGQSWIEYRLLQIEDAERQKSQLLKQTQEQNRTRTQAVSMGWER